MSRIGSLEELDLVIKAVIGLMGALASFLIYLHYRQQRKDSWLRDFRELHRAFWNDDAMADVRAWLANDQAYGEVVQVLISRREVAEGTRKPEKISREEYVVLEKLDKFCNLMTSVRVLDPRFSNHKVLWQRLFVEYWIEQIFSEKRREIGWYVEKFYEELTKDWRRKTRVQRIRARFKSAFGEKGAPRPQNPAPAADG